MIRLNEVWRLHTHWDSWNTVCSQERLGYIKYKPYRQNAPTVAPVPPVATTTTAASEAEVEKETSKLLEVPTNESTNAAPASTATTANTAATADAPPPSPGLTQKSWPLLGPWLNSFVVYVDATTAWLMTDDIYGKISSTVFQRITSGQNLGGVKLVRGWVDKSPAAAAVAAGKEKAVASVSGSRPVTPTPGTTGRSSKRSSLIEPKKDASPGVKKDDAQEQVTAGRMALERKMSNLLGMDEHNADPEKMMEEEMKEDYKNSDENENDREVEHL